MHTRHIFAALHDEIVADLPEDSHHPRGCIVVLGMLPNEQQGVHNRLEEIHHGGDVIHGVQLL